MIALPPEIGLIGNSGPVPPGGPAVEQPPAEYIPYRPDGLPELGVESSARVTP